MNSLQKLIIVSGLLIMIGCHKTGIRHISESDFLKETELSEQRILTNTIFNIEEFFVKDTFVVVRNSRNDSIFMVLGLNTFNCIKSWGNTGNGPSEYLSPRLINSSSNGFYIANFGHRKLEDHTIPEFNKAEQKMVENTDIPQNIVSADSLLIYDKFNPTSQELVIWQNGLKPKTIYNFDDLKHKYSNTNIYRGFIGVNKTAKRIVYAYQYIRRFDILDYEGNIIKNVEIEPNTPPQLREDKGIDPINSKTYYFGLKTTEDFFFLYYVGYSGDNLRKNMNVNTFIEQYDWNGNPVKRYKIPRFLWNFDICKNGESMAFLGLDQSNESPFIRLSEK